MPSHRGETRRQGYRPAPVKRASEPASTARGVSVEESFIPDVDELPRPAGFGTEDSTSSTSFQLLESYVVPDGHLARLVELSVSVEDNGEAAMSVTGTVFGPYTGATDVDVPLDGTVLPPLYHVDVYHRSTDGSSTTTKAQVVALEV